MDQTSPEPEGREAAAAETSHSSSWFYVQHGETYGPVSSADLRAAAHLGFLSPDDIVRRADRTEWISASSLRGLFKQPD
jgi:hypothetical protein